MTLEEKLKAKEVIYVPNCILIEDALEIIKAYEKQVRVDENNRWIKFISDGYGLHGGVDGNWLKTRINELKDMKWKQL